MRESRGRKRKKKKITSFELDFLINKKYFIKLLAEIRRSLNSQKIKINQY